ncbi:MAG: RsmE family RNA methyltransferase [Planctomycetota bacterium]
MDRFLVDEIIDGRRAILSPAESRHLLAVMRHTAGDEVEVRDGAGRRFRARVAGREAGRAVVDLIEELCVPTQGLPEMTLAQAILKGKRMDLLVEKAVELGVRRIVPVVTQRTVVRLDERFGQKRARWQRKIAGAVKQSGCAGAPELAEPVTFTDLLPTVARYELACLAALTSDAQPLARVLGAARDVRSLLFIVGPEGDFTLEELELARRTAGCRFVSLAPHVLRGETAALVALAGALYEFGGRA